MELPHDYLLHTAVDHMNDATVHNSGSLDIGKLNVSLRQWKGSTSYTLTVTYTPNGSGEPMENRTEQYALTQIPVRNTGQ